MNPDSLVVFDPFACRRPHLQEGVEAVRDYGELFVADDVPARDRGFIEAAQMAQFELSQSLLEPLESFYFDIFV